MSIVLAVSSNKGGVGKTTTAVTIASYFAYRRHWKVLLLDADAQGHVGLFIGVKDAENPRARSGLYALIVENRPLSEVVVTARENLDIVGNSDEGMFVEQAVAASKDRNSLLSRALRGNQYDLVVLDTAPAVSELLKVALCAADYVILPTGPTFAEITGLARVLNTVNELVQIGYEKIPAVIGALPTRFERVTTNARENYDDLYEKLRARNIQTLPPIPNDINLKTCTDYGQSVWEFSPKTRGVVGFDRPLEHAKIPNSIGGYGGYLHLVEILEIFLKRGGSRS